MASSPHRSPCRVCHAAETTALGLEQRPRRPRSACPVHGDATRGAMAAHRGQHTCSRSNKPIAQRSPTCGVCGGARPGARHCPMHGHVADLNREERGERSAKATVYPESLQSSTRSVASSGTPLDVRSTVRALGAAADDHMSSHAALRPRLRAAPEHKRGHALCSSFGRSPGQNVSPNHMPDMVTPILQKPQRGERGSLAASLRRLARVSASRRSRSPATSACTSAAAPHTLRTAAADIASRTLPGATAATNGTRRSKGSVWTASGGARLSSCAPGGRLRTLSPRRHRVSRSKSPMRRHTGDLRGLSPDGVRLPGTPSRTLAAEDTAVRSGPQSLPEHQCSPREHNSTGYRHSASVNGVAQALNVASPYKCVAGHLANLAAHMEQATSPQTSCARPLSTPSRTQGLAGGLARSPPAALTSGERFAAPCTTAGSGDLHAGLDVATQRVVAECLDSAVQDLCRRLRVPTAQRPASNQPRNSTPPRSLSASGSSLDDALGRIAAVTAHWPRPQGSPYASPALAHMRSPGVTQAGAFERMTAASSPAASLGRPTYTALERTQQSGGARVVPTSPAKYGESVAAQSAAQPQHFDIAQGVQGMQQRTGPAAAMEESLSAKRNTASTGPTPWVVPAAVSRQVLSPGSGSMERLGPHALRPACESPSLGHMRGQPGGSAQAALESPSGGRHMASQQHAARPQTPGGSATPGLRTASEFFRSPVHARSTAPTESAQPRRCNTARPQLDVTPPRQDHGTVHRAMPHPALPCVESSQEARANTKLQTTGAPESSACEAVDVPSNTAPDRSVDLLVPDERSSAASLQQFGSGGDGEPTAAFTVFASRHEILALEASTLLFHAESLVAALEATDSPDAASSGLAAVQQVHQLQSVAQRKQQPPTGCEHSAHAVEQHSQLPVDPHCSTCPTGVSESFQRGDGHLKVDRSGHDCATNDMQHPWQSRTADGPSHQFSVLEQAVQAMSARLDDAGVALHGVPSACHSQPPASAALNEPLACHLWREFDAASTAVSMSGLRPGRADDCGISSGTPAPISAASLLQPGSGACTVQSASTIAVQRQHELAEGDTQAFDTLQATLLCHEEGTLLAQAPAACTMSDPAAAQLLQCRRSSVASPGSMAALVNPCNMAVSTGAIEAQCHRVRVGSPESAASAQGLGLQCGEMAAPSTIGLSGASQTLTSVVACRAAISSPAAVSATENDADDAPHVCGQEHASIAPAGEVPQIATQTFQHKLASQAAAAPSQACTATMSQKDRSIEPACLQPDSTAGTHMREPGAAVATCDAAALPPAATVTSEVAAQTLCKIEKAPSSGATARAPHPVPVEHASVSTQACTDELPAKGLACNAAPGEAAPRCVDLFSSELVATAGAAPVSPVASNPSSQGGSRCQDPSAGADAPGVATSAGATAVADTWRHVQATSQSQAEEPNDRDELVVQTIGADQRAIVALPNASCALEPPGVDNSMQAADQHTRADEAVVAGSVDAVADAVQSTPPAEERSSAVPRDAPLPGPFLSSEEHCGAQHNPSNEIHFALSATSAVKPAVSVSGSGCHSCDSAQMPPAASVASADSHSLPVTSQRAAGVLSRISETAFAAVESVAGIQQRIAAAAAPRPREQSSSHDASAPIPALQACEPQGGSVALVAIKAQHANLGTEEQPSPASADDTAAAHVVEATLPSPTVRVTAGGSGPAQVVLAGAAHGMHAVSSRMSDSSAGAVVMSHLESTTFEVDGPSLAPPTLQLLPNSALVDAAPARSQEQPEAREESAGGRSALSAEAANHTTSAVVLAVSNNAQQSVQSQPDASMATVTSVLSACSERSAPHGSGFVSAQAHTADLQPSVPAPSHLAMSATMETYERQQSRVSSSSFATTHEWTRMQLTAAMERSTGEATLHPSRAQLEPHSTRLQHARSASHEQLRLDGAVEAVSRLGAPAANAPALLLDAAQVPSAAQSIPPSEQTLTHAPTMPLLTRRPAESAGPELAHALIAPAAAQPFVEADIDALTYACTTTSPLQHASTAPQAVLCSQVQSSGLGVGSSVELQHAGTAPVATLRAVGGGSVRQASVAHGDSNVIATGAVAAVQHHSSAHDEAGLARLLYAESECEGEGNLSAGRAQSPDQPPAGLLCSSMAGNATAAVGQEVEAPHAPQVRLGASDGHLAARAEARRGVGDGSAELPTLIAAGPPAAHAAQPLDDSHWLVGVSPAWREQQALELEAWSCRMAPNEARACTTPTVDDSDEAAADASTVPGENVRIFLFVEPVHFGGLSRVCTV